MLGWVRKQSRNMSNARPVKTTKTSMRIVDEIRDRDGATLAELNAKLDLGRTTLYNHLSTLTDEQFLTKQGECYHVGLRFLEYGEFARNRRPVYNPAKIQVHRLAEATNEEAIFAVEENGLMFTIEYVMGDANPSNPEAGSQFLKVGSKFNMHSSASGKAVLSELPRKKVQRIIDRHGLAPTTDSTITDEDELLSELSEIREQGFATNDEELERGYRSIAVPILDAGGEVIGALAVGGPAYRVELSSPEVENVVSTLNESIQRVEDAMSQFSAED